jgi:hypothetical protein
MDFPEIVEGGIKQMLELLGDDNAPFDVCIFNCGFNMGWTLCTFQAFSLVLTAGSPYWWLCWCFHKGWIQNLLVVHHFVEYFISLFFCVIQDVVEPFTIVNSSLLQVVRSSGKKHIKQEGYSYPLCCKIVEVLHKSQLQFHLRSFCVLENNTKSDSFGNALPIIGGFVVSDFLSSASVTLLVSWHQSA